jgi:hypothetical protein
MVRDVLFQQLKSAGKETKITGFTDRTISNGRVIIDLIDAIRPNSIVYTVVKPGDDDEVRSLRHIYRLNLMKQAAFDNLPCLHSLYRNEFAVCWFKRSFDP